MCKTPQQQLRLCTGNLMCATVNNSSNRQCFIRLECMHFAHVLDGVLIKNVDCYKAIIIRSVEQSLNSQFFGNACLMFYCNGV